MNYMDDQTIKVSIVIPVYNCENLLRRTIDCVLSQSYSNIQLILIDDGSIDNSPNICDEYESQDSRVNVVHQENAGASAARNTGLKWVQGDYVAFIDADDMVSKQYIEILLYCALSTKTRISTCEAFYCRENEYKQYPIETLRPRVIKVPDYNFMEAWSHATVWGALFKKNLLTDLMFDTEISVGEDSLFFANALAQCDSVSYISNKLYYYFIYDQSVSHGIYNEKRLSEFTAWQKINTLVAPISETLDESSKARMVRHAIERYKEVLRQDVPNEDILIFFRNMILKNKDSYLKLNSSQKAKIEMYLILKTPKMYKIAYRKHKS